MEQYNVTGMSCAACSSRVEKAVSKVDGVTECSVSLLTNSMGVSGTASPEAIIKAVEDAGYHASLKGSDKESNKLNDEDALKDKETPLLKKRLIASLIFLIVLMYFSMGHMMFGWPLPKVIEGNHVAMGLIQMLLTIIIMVINQRFFVSGFKSLLHGAPNMDTLVALGSGAAFVYSTYALFAMTDAVMNGNHMMVMHYMDEFYFESAAMILTLITVGKMLEARSKGKTTDALKSLMNLAPKTANIIVNGETVSVPVEKIKKGDIFVVRPGENIPVDGIIVEGSSAVNESALTGESIPVDKEINDEVSAATLNMSGFIKCEATRVGEDTTLSKIIQMVSDAAATKAPIAKIADKVSGVFVPSVITIAIITTIVWLIAGKEFGYALARGISVLVISCPCALGLATPVAIMVGNGVGAKNGIMFKTAVALEQTGKMNIVALDKTGTITKGEPKVTDIISADDVTEDELIKYAYMLEEKSEHPLAKAVVSYVTDKESDIQEEYKKNAALLTDFSIAAGNGLSGMYNGTKLIGGNKSYISGYIDIPDKITAKADELSSESKTPLFFAMQGKFLGVIAVADTIKEDSPEAIKELKNMGIKVVMITGDNQKSADAIGRIAGVDEVIAGVLPDGKEQQIKRLKERGKVIMVGDGINDAPALTQADIGIAIGAGTDVAIDAADVVLMKSSLSDVPATIRLSHSTLKNIHENLFWAFFYNIIGIPLAAGVWIPIFGWTLNPMFGAAAMSLSSFCVVTNALRLNLVKIYDSSKDARFKNKRSKNKIKNAVDTEKSENAVDTEKSGDAGNNDNLKENVKNNKGETTMEKIIMIEGMMCGHCEARVKKCLEAIDGVNEAVASHEKGTAVVTLSKDVDNEVLKKAVEDQDYKVTGIN